MDSPIRFNEEFVLKISRRIMLESYDGFGADVIIEDLKRLGIDDAAVVGSTYHFRILFDTQEDLNLYKLSGNIEEESVLNTGEILYRFL